MMMRDNALILLILAIVYIDVPLRALDTVERINGLVDAVMSSQSRAFLEDEEALLQRLSIDDAAEYRVFIERMLDSSNQLEFMVLRDVWKVVARNGRQFAAISSASVLLESDASSKVDSIADVMRITDTPARGERWDFSHYDIVLETVGQAEAARLLSYMFEQSPAAGLQTAIGTYGDDVPLPERTKILDRTWEIEKGLKKQGDVLVGEEEKRAFLDFAESLREYESELLDAYLAAVLRREYLINVSPELREQLEGSSALARSFFSDEIEQSAFPPLQTPIFDELVSLSETSESGQPDDTPEERDGGPERGDIAAEEADLELPESPSSSRSPVWPYVLVAVALVGIVVVLVRSRKGNPGH